KARGIELEHHGWQSTWRQTPQIGHRKVRDIAKSGIGIAPRLEVNLDQAYARQRAGLDMVDVAAEGKKALERVGNVGLDLLRRHPRIEGRNHHYRNLDLREQIHRHPNHGGHTDHGDHQTKHDHEEWVVQSESRHLLSLSRLTIAGTRGPRFQLLLQLLFQLRRHHLADRVVGLTGTDHSLFFREPVNDLHGSGGLLPSLNVPLVHAILIVQSQHVL